MTTVGQCLGGTLPTLVVPAGQRVELDVTSADVIHAFWVPYLETKTYAYPDHTNILNVTVPQTGRWIGRCGQVCGIYHYEMDFWLQAVPPAVFDRFLRSGAALPGVSRS